MLTRFWRELRRFVGFNYERQTIFYAGWSGRQQELPFNGWLSILVLSVVEQ